MVVTNIYKDPKCSEEHGIWFFHPYAILCQKILAVAVENRMGISFNGRKCSDDDMIHERLPYLSPLFCNYHILKSHDDIKKCINRQQNGIFYAEIIDPSPYIDYFDEIVLFRWNRDYPSDVKFTADMPYFKHVQTNEFAGKAHEKILEDVYIHFQMENSEG